MGEALWKKSGKVVEIILRLQSSTEAPRCPSRNTEPALTSFHKLWLDANASAQYPSQRDILQQLTGDAFIWEGEKADQFLYQQETTVGIRIPFSFKQFCEIWY